MDKTELRQKSLKFVRIRVTREKMDCGCLCLFQFKNWSALNGHRFKAREDASACNMFRSWGTPATGCWGVTATCLPPL